LGFISTAALMIDKQPTPLQFVIPKGWPKPSTDIFLNNKYEGYIDLYK
jgi:hypothetical protein